jgi:hypothetical protein
MLSGPNKGQFVPFYEVAGGIGTDGGVGFEVGRLDYWGKRANFTKEDIYGERNKGYASISPFGELLSLGLSDAVTSKDNDGNRMNISSFQLGLGLSTPFVSGGWNTGHTIKPGDPVPKED